VNFAPPRRQEEQVDVTPLIDIIFQLVLFFMVSTTFVNSPGIEVDLPRSSADTIIRDKEDLNVWMTAGGAIYVDRQSVTWSQLQGQLSGAASRDRNTVVIIKADREVEHGRVVAVMDLARSYGLLKLAIATEPVADD
jgi:biopolymer transport protein ExbD